MEEIKSIPKITVKEDQLVVETFDVPIIFNDEESIVKMRKLTAGEKQDIVKRVSTIKAVGTQATGTVDSLGYMIAVLSKVIADAPFPADEKFISSLPDSVSEYLFEEYSNNTESVSKKKD